MSAHVSALCLHWGNDPLAAGANRVGHWWIQNHQPITTKLEVKPSSGSAKKFFCCHSNLNTRLDRSFTHSKPSQSKYGENYFDCDRPAACRETFQRDGGQWERSVRGQWEVSSIAKQEIRFSLSASTARLIFIWADCEEEFLSWSYHGSFSSLLKTATTFASNYSHQQLSPE